MKKISIIIPVWNEEKTLEKLVEKVRSVDFPGSLEKEIILVNDGSKDKSLKIMEELSTAHKEISHYNNERNLGKSQTVRNGVLKSTGDLVIVQDADFEYDPEEIVTLIKEYKVKGLDVVYGNRFGKDNPVIYWQNWLGNRLLSFISNVFTYPRIKKYIPDMEVCYKLMDGHIAREVFKTVESKSSFGLEPEVTAKLSRYKRNGKRLKFGVVPISYFPRSIEEGKKMNAFKDGVKALKEIIHFNLF